MTDKKIKEEFEKWLRIPATHNEQRIYDNDDDLSYSDHILNFGFYAGFRAAERIAKIEVLDEVLYMIDDFEFRTEPSHANAKLRISNMIESIKAGN